MWASRVAAAIGIIAGSSCAPRLPWGGLSTGPRAFHLDTNVSVHRLDNGMVVALMPDTRTNLVSVDVRYLVGSADDPDGRAGMAHLVEHLQFDRRPVAGGPSLGESLGEAALWANAWTSPDHTHYAEVALADRLDDILAIEAERMAADCDQLDNATFLRERDVVLDEAAQRADFGFDGPRVAKAVWGADHPYAADRIDEIADATRDEACAFLEGHYGPNRAILVMVGAFDPAEALQKIVARFKPLANRAIEPRTKLPLPPLQHDRVEVEEGRRSGIIVSFAAPAVGDEDAGDARLAVLQMQKALNWSLSHEDGIGRGEVSIIGVQRQRLFVVSVSVEEGHFARAEKLVYQAAGMVRRGGSDRGVEIWRSQRRAAVANQVDELWGRGEWLADYLEDGDAGQLFLDTFTAIDRASQDSSAAWATENLVEDRSNVVIVHAAEKGSSKEPPRATSAIKHNEPVWQAVVDPAEATVAMPAPEVTKHAAYVDETLDNGLRVVFAPDPSSVMVDARLVLPVGGYGVARRAAHALTDDLAPDVDTHDLEVLDWVMGLGTNVGGHASDRTTTFSANGLALFADWHVWRLFYRWHRGVYPERKHKQSAKDDNEFKKLLDYFASDPTDVLLGRLFGPEHPYFKWPEHEETNDEVKAFRAAYYRVNGATLIVSGGFEVDAMRAAVTRLFGALPDTAPEPPPVPMAMTPPDKAAWVQVIDELPRQVTFAIGFAPIEPTDSASARASSAILTEMVSERLALLRARDGATYGMGAFVIGGESGRALIVTGDVDPSRATDALRTVLDDLTAVHEGKDLAADFVRARRTVLARAIASSAGATTVAEEIESAIKRGGNLDVADEYAAAIAATTVDDVLARAVHDLDPDHRVVVIGGDPEVVEPVLNAVGATDVEKVRRPERPW